MSGIPIDDDDILRAAQGPTDNYDLSAGGVKYDSDKIRTDLVPMEAFMAEAAVFTYGAKKYSDWNWAKGMRKGRIVAAMMRHLAAYMCGQDIDPESGLPHLWHVRCCTAMLIAGELRGVAEEDRQIAEGAYDSVEAMFRNRNDYIK